MANNKDFKVKNGIGPTVYHETVGTVTSAGVGPVDAFSTTLYSGTGAAQSIGNGIDLSTDGGLVWTKATDSTYSHTLIDTENGGDLYLYSNDTRAHTDPSSVYITAFNTNGYSIGTANELNNSTTDYVSWTFKEESKFFDIVTYTGTGSAQTVSHNLGTTVGCLIIKRTDSASSDGWIVYHDGFSKGVAPKIAFLNSTDAAFQANSTYLNSTYPTSTEFSVGEFADTNASGGSYVAYLFAHDTASTSMIKCDSYTGNGSTTGPEIDLGWQPQWIMIKNASSGSTNWAIFDVERGITNDGSNDPFLRPNLTNADASAFDCIDLTDTGFQIKYNGAFINTNGDTYVYVAIRKGENTATLDMSTGSVFEHTVTKDEKILLSNPADSGVVSNATLLLQNNYKDISTLSYDNIGLTGLEDSAPRAIQFKTDGTKMYILGAGNDKIYQFSLSTPWDVSTFSYDSVSFSQITQETAAQGLWIKPDGTKFYLAGPSSDTVYQYSMSTAWDMSTASYDNVSKSVSTEDSSPSSLFFRKDGLKMFVLGNQYDKVFQYTLSTAWDISTATYDSKSLSLSTQDTNVKGMWFVDSKTIYIIGTGSSDSIFEYTLTTDWDVSTGSYTGNSYSFTTLDGNMEGMYIYKDKLYMVGSGTDKVFQFSLSSFAITYDDSIKFNGGTAPTAPSSGETDILTFSTRDGGTSYQAVLAMDGVS